MSFGTTMEMVIESMDGIVISGGRAMRTCKTLGLPCPRIIVQCDRSEALRLRSQVLLKSLSLKRLLLWLKDRPKVHVKNDAQAMTAKILLKELGADAPQRDLLPHTLKRAVRDVRRTRMPPQTPLAGEVQVEHCDFRDLNLEPGSVDLIFTDPLYGKKYLPLYSELGKFAAEVLKSGGLLLAYAPQLYLDDVIRRLGEHLVFHWQIVLVNEECSQPNFSRGFFSGHRPALIHTKGRIEMPEDYARDTFQRGPKEKSLYVYQQPVDEAIYYIGKLTKLGDLICDPFLGSGTTAVACKQLGRRFIGCDIDLGCVNMARKRVREATETVEIEIKNHERTTI